MIFVAGSIFWKVDAWGWGINWIEKGQCQLESQGFDVRDLWCWKETESLETRLIGETPRRLQQLEDRQDRHSKPCLFCRWPQRTQNVQWVENVPSQSRYIQDKAETYWKKIKKSIVQTSVLKVSLKSLEPCKRHVNLKALTSGTIRNEALSQLQGGKALFLSCDHLVGNNERAPSKSGNPHGPHLISTFHFKTFSKHLDHLPGYGADKLDHVDWMFVSADLRLQTAGDVFHINFLRKILGSRTLKHTLQPRHFQPLATWSPRPRGSRVCPL